jgi:hypothetical protein
MREIKNIYGKFPDISLDIFIFLHSLPQMSMESFHGHSCRYSYFQERMWENKNVCGKFSDISTDIYIFSNSFSQMSMGILQTFLFSGRKVGK